MILLYNYPLKAAAIIHMLLNNLDPAVAQFPQELVTYGGNGQVLCNGFLWMVIFKCIQQVVKVYRWKTPIKDVHRCSLDMFLICSSWCWSPCISFKYPTALAGIFVQVRDLRLWDQVLSNWGQFRLVLHYLATMRWSFSFYCCVCALFRIYVRCT